MRVHLWATFMASSLLWMLPAFLFAAVQISEVQFNPVGTDTGAEYIAIRNSGSTSEQLNGWQLYPDGIGYFVFGDVSLAAGSTLTIRLRTSGTGAAGEIFHSTATSNMGNTSGSVALFNSSDRSASTMVDFVEWGKAGETWESAADSAGIWAKGNFVDVASASEGQALLRSSAGAGATTWSLGVATSPTPVPDSGTHSTAPASPEPSSNTGNTNSDTSGGATSANAAQTNTGTYRAVISGDTHGAIGSVVQFSGSLLSPKNESITVNSSQYVWNFGDGGIGNGNRVEHIYQFPGTYTISLTIPHEKVALSAYQRITLSPANVHITEVLPGTEGWIEITNGASSALNLSRWLLVSGGASFMFPAGTVVAPNASVVFPASSTKLSVPAAAPNVTLQLANGVPADLFSTIALVPNGSSAARSGESIVFGVPTPGVHSGSIATPPAAPTASVPEKYIAAQRITNVASAAVKTVETTISRASTTLAEAETAPLNSGTSALLFGVRREYVLLLASIVAGALLGALYYRYRVKTVSERAQA